MRGRPRGSGRRTREEDSVGCGSFEGTPGTPTLDRNDNEQDLRSSHNGLVAKEQEETIVANNSNLDSASPDSNPSGIFRDIDLNLALDENGETSTSTSTIA